MRSEDRQSEGSSPKRVDGPKREAVRPASYLHVLCRGAAESYLITLPRCTAPLPQHLRPSPAHFRVIPQRFSSTYPSSFLSANYPPSEFSVLPPIPP